MNININIRICIRIRTSMSMSVYQIKMMNVCTLEMCVEDTAILHGACLIHFKYEAPFSVLRSPLRQYINIDIRMYFYGAKF